MPAPDECRGEVTETHPARRRHASTSSCGRWRAGRAPAPSSSTSTAPWRRSRRPRPTPKCRGRSGRLLARLAPRVGLLAFVTGREVGDGRDLLPLRGAVYIGNHGLQALLPVG